MDYLSHTYSPSILLHIPYYNDPWRDYRWYCLYNVQNIGGCNSYRTILLYILFIKTEHKEVIRCSIIKIWILKGSKEYEIQKKKNVTFGAICSCPSRLTFKTRSDFYVTGFVFTVDGAWDFTRFAIITRCATTYIG